MPKFDVTGPDGKTYRVDTPAGASEQQAIAYVAKTYYSGKPAEPKPETPKAAPAPVAAAPEDEGFFSALGRAAKRGVPNLRRGLAQVVEDYPEIVGSLISTLSPGNAQFNQVATALGKAAAKSETYKGLTGEMVASERKAAEKQLADIGPRKYGG